MASALNLCQHSDSDGTSCTSDDYILCPHCQLQLCLKHLNAHQDLLRSDCQILSNQIDRVRCNLDHLRFDSSNHRADLTRQLDQWYRERLESINRIYAEKQQQLQILCLQAQIEFDTYKAKKEKQLKENLCRRWRKISQQKQIHVDDLNDMAHKLDTIERGLDELQQLLIDIYIDRSTMEINIVKRRYVEAAKPSFNDDDDNYLWDIEDEEDESQEKSISSDDPRRVGDVFNPMSYPSSSPDMILVSSSPDSSQLPMPPCSSSSEMVVTKVPLKFIIKRLRQPTASNKVKYKLHSVATSPSLTA